MAITESYLEETPIGNGISNIIEAHVIDIKLQIDLQTTNKAMTTVSWQLDKNHTSLKQHSIVAKSFLEVTGPPYSTKRKLLLQKEYKTTILFSLLIPYSLVFLLGNGTQTQLNNNHKRGTQSTKHRDDAMTVTKDINVENPIMGKTKPRDPTDSELFYYRRREYKDTHKEQPYLDV